MKMHGAAIRFIDIVVFDYIPFPKLGTISPAQWHVPEDVDLPFS